MKLQITELQNKYNLTKFEIKEDIQKNIELKKQIAVLERSNKEMEEQILNIEKSIQTMDDKIDSRVKNEKFIDILSNELYICKNLSYFYYMCNDKKSREFIKNYESLKEKQILSNDKFKLLQYLGNFCEALEDVLDIDNISFSSMQNTFYNIKIKEELHESNEIKLLEAITLKVYLVENLSEKLLKKASFEDNKNIKTYQIHILEYDEYYFIKKKYKMIDLKIIACRYWELDLEEFVMCDEKFQIFPYDLIVYDEIFALNVEKKFIKFHSQFFHMNSLINVNYF